MINDPPSQSRRGFRTFRRVKRGGRPQTAVGGLPPCSRSRGYTQRSGGSGRASGGVVAVRSRAAVADARRHVAATAQPRCGRRGAGTVARPAPAARGRAAATSAARGPRLPSPVAAECWSQVLIVVRVASLRRLGGVASGDGPAPRWRRCGRRRGSAHRGDGGGGNLAVSVVVQGRSFAPLQRLG